ncbi:hypothetical protein, partial [Mesorhizobium sp.]
MHGSNLACGLRAQGWFDQLHTRTVTITETIASSGPWANGHISLFVFDQYAPADSCNLQKNTGLTGANQKGRGMKYVVDTIGGPT